MKRKLRLDDLSVESFATAPDGGGARGTVRAQGVCGPPADTAYEICYSGSCQISCGGTCERTCDNLTCAATCHLSCNPTCVGPTCDFAVVTCGDTCPPYC